MGGLEATYYHKVEIAVTIAQRHNGQNNYLKTHGLHIYIKNIEIYYNNIYRTNECETIL